MMNIQQESVSNQNSRNMFSLGCEIEVTFERVECLNAFVTTSINLAEEIRDPK